MNPLGVHFTPTHQGRHHYDFIRRMQPDLLKIVGSGQVGTPDVQIMANGYEAAPNALHIYRNQPLSEQHDALWADPAGTAVRHVSTLASEMALRINEAAQRGLRLPYRDQCFITGINEPVIELFPRDENMSNYHEWLSMVEHRASLLDTYMATFIAECDRYDLRSVVGNFSGGQPANRKPGEYATYDWFPKTRKALEASKGRHFLAVNEYWDVDGPEENPDWWTWRWKHCDWDCRIVVLESGVDRQIRSKTYEGNRGWQGHMTPAQYIDQHRRYMLGCLTDPRFGGATPFTLDGAREWSSFYIEPCMNEMVALAEELRGLGSGKPQEKPVEVRLPDIRNDAPKPQPAPAGIIEPRVAQAILNVESGSRTHGADGKLIIRFEAHIFKTYLGNDDLWGRHFRVDLSKPWTDQAWRRDAGSPWAPIHTGSQASEWEVFTFACSLNVEAACKAISMGAPQIMGFNHARIGYPSAKAMFDAFQDGQVQTIGFINFFLSDPALVDAMRRKDWREVARRYNGSGQVDHYAALLQAAYANLGG